MGLAGSEEHSGQGGLEGVLGTRDGAVAAEVRGCGSVPLPAARRQRHHAGVGLLKRRSALSWRQRARRRLHERHHAGIANLVVAETISTPVAITLHTATTSLSVHFNLL